jgi:uncharacterized protein (DUF2141 family)
LATAGLGAEDVQLVRQQDGAAFTPATFDYDAVLHAVSVTFNNLSEGNYALRLLSSPTAFRDRVNRLLDGSPSFPLPSGDGTPGDPFEVDFVVDTISVPVTQQVQALEPSGARLWTIERNGRFHASGDVDLFTLDLAAHQNTTIRLTPTSGAIVGSIELIAPDGTSLGSYSGTAASETVLTDTLANVAPGIYQVRVESLAGDGDYAVEILVNAGVSRENYGGAENNSPATAQAIDATALSLLTEDQLAVSGRVGAGQDFYSFDLAAQESASLYLTALGSAPVQLELWNATGVIARGIAGEASNVAEFLHRFAAPVAGTYYARVTGDEGAAYTLVVMRDATFELEKVDSLPRAELLESLHPVAGSLHLPVFRLEPDNVSSGTPMPIEHGIDLRVGNTSDHGVSLTPFRASTGSRVIAPRANLATWNSSTWLKGYVTDSSIREISVDVIPITPGVQAVLRVYRAYTGGQYEEVYLPTQPVREGERLVLQRYVPIPVCLRHPASWTFTEVFCVCCHC